MPLKMIKPLKILLVEDDAISAMMLEIELKEYGHKVVRTVPTGEGAVKSLPETKPDLILMDIGLPGEWNGIEAAERIRKTSAVPIVFTTGYSLSEFAGRVEKLESTRYVNKPMKIETLLSAVDSLFNQPRQK
jgi:CheY-like chemotaxis protein